MAGRSESESRWGGNSDVEWMKLAVEATGIGTWEFNLEEGIGFISDRCAEIMGCPELSQGQPVRFEEWLAMIQWENRRRVKEACNPEGDGELKMRLKLIVAGGVIREVLVRGRAFFSVREMADDKPVRRVVRLLGIVRDLSERHLYQRALNESDQRLRWALEQAPIPIMIHSDDGQVIELNGAWQHITGFSVAEVATLDAWAVASWGRSDARAKLEQIHRAGEDPAGSPVELAFRTKHGEIRRWLFYSAELGNMNQGRRARMISAIDLTEQKAAEEERNRALGQAETANRSKDQFLATLSHELRTPLNAILGWIFLMKQGSVKPEVQKEGISVIERNARAQSNLIADLLDISRIVAGKLRLEPRELNFLSCLKSALENIRPSAKEKGVRILSRVDTSLAPAMTMFGDQVRLEQVISNLFVNAIKFTPFDGTIAVSLEVDDSVVRLKVTDNGIGIDPGFIPGLFDSFSQAESPRKSSGLGLGLTISRHIVELHGGKIFATSEGVGKGSSFTVELPIASVQKEYSPEEGVLSHLREKAVTTLKDVTVVVVDDNADARGFINQVLKQRGATVISVETGEKAIQAVLRYHPDVVLCDLMMPGMDGHAVLRHIRTLEDEAAKNVPVVALTALAGAENRFKTQQAGFQIHLDKPVDPPQLVQTIQTLVKSKEIGKQSKFETADACG